MIYEYWLTNLNNKEKAFYQEMKQGFIHMRKRININNLTNEEVVKTYLYFRMDHPDLFYLSTKFEIEEQNGVFFKQKTLVITHLFTDSDIRNYQNSINIKVNNLLNHLNTYSSHVDKEQRICDLIIKNVNYEIDNIMNQNAGTVLVKGKGQCTGIASAVKLICDKVGMKCIIVFGEAIKETGNVAHAWNMIEINDKWYHLDVTYMLGYNTSKMLPFKYAYFNLSDDEIKTNHLWDMGSTPKTTKDVTTSNIVIPTGSEEVCYTYFGFKQSINKIIVSRIKTYQFKSLIRTSSLQELNEGLQKICLEMLRNNNVAGSFTIDINDSYVKIIFTYR